MELSLKIANKCVISSPKQVAPRNERKVVPDRAIVRRESGIIL